MTNAAAGLGRPPSRYRSMHPMSSNFTAFSSASSTSAANRFCDIAIRQKPHMSAGSISTGRGERERHAVKRVSTSATVIVRMQIPQVHLFTAKLLETRFLQCLNRQQPSVDQNRDTVGEPLDVRQHVCRENNRPACALHTG